MPASSILVADDDTAIRTVLNQALSRAGYEVRLTGNAATLWRWVSQGEGDLVITDVVMPDENAFDLLPRIKKMRPNLPVIVMSAQNTFMTAIRASERGAYEYLPKPFDLKELIAIVGRALAEPKERAATPVDESEFDSIPLVGRSPAMQEIYRVLARLMQTDLTVMISGESGTGKELVARALHDYGKRRNGPFVAVNMAAIPRDLIESELFGHERGAFTGANTRASGRFEQAEGGTLFLDEIGDMPMEAQTRLLRVLQQGEYTTVGGRTPIKTDVRIVAASNKDLRILIQQGLFREDLFFRLNVVPLRLPPLRERIEDLPDLVRHFFALAEKDGLPPKKLDALVGNVLLPNFDTDYSARLVLGQTWRTATPEQRKRFVDAFYQSLLRNYGAALIDFTSDRFVVLPYKGDPNETTATVRTEVKRESGAKVPVNFSLRKTPDGWKAWDVVIDGISYVKSFRTDFAAEIQQKGLDDVITRLETEGRVGPNSAAVSGH